MILSPGEYAETSTPELLNAAARGQVGIDHRWLRAILDRGEEVFDDFAAFLKQEHEQDAVDIGPALLDMARQLRSPRALGFLVEYARLVEDDFPDALVEAFIPLGEAAVEPLLQLYDDAGHPTDISFTLASLGVRDNRILELLTAELDESPLEAAISLTRYGDPAAKPAIESALAQAEDDSTRFALTEALREIGTAEREQIEPFDIWSHYPAEEPPRFDLLSEAELSEMLGSEAAEYRAAAAGELGFLHFGAETRERLLELARSDADEKVRAECWEAIGGALEHDRDIAEEMRRRFYDASVPDIERAGLAVGLAFAGELDEAAPARIRELVEKPETRAAALRAMWRSMDRRFGDAVVRYLDDPNLDVRREALAAAGWLGLTAQVGVIEKAMLDEDLREVALHSYVLAAPGETSPARMRSLFRKIEDLAGGLSEDEADIVRTALDVRLQLQGYEPQFTEEEQEWGEEEEEAPGADLDEGVEIDPPFKVGRNDPCPCGSGKKYKRCCGK